MLDVLTSFEGIIGVVLGLVILAFLVASNAYRNEKSDAEYLRDSLQSARHFADSRWDELKEAEVKADEVSVYVAESDWLLDEASALIHAFIDELDDADEDLVDLEDEVEELETELEEVVAGWEDANALVEKTIAWGTRILDAMDESGPGVRKPYGYVVGKERG